MGLVYKICERPSGALVATEVTRAPGVIVLLVFVIRAFFRKKHNRSQGSNWVKAPGAEKARPRNRPPKAAGDMGGRLRPPSGSKGRALGRGPGGGAPGSSDVFSTVMHYIDSQKTPNMEDKIYFDVCMKVYFYPYPPLCKIFSHQIYTDLRNYQI